MAKATHIKDNISLGLAHRLRDSVYCHHGGKHGSVQADMALEDARALQDSRRGLCPQGSQEESFFHTGRSPSTEWHTSSNRVTHLLLVALRMSNIQTRESTGTDPIQATIVWDSKCINQNMVISYYHD